MADAREWADDTSRTRRSTSRRPCMNLQRSESARRAPASASSRRASAPPHEEPARSSPTRSRKPARRRRRRLTASSPRRSRTDHQGQAAMTVMAASLRRLPAKYRRACLLSHPPCKWRADGNSQTDTWIFSGSSRCGDDHRRGLLFNGCSALICRHETQKNLHSACAEYCHGRRFWRNLLCRAKWKRYRGGISRCAMGFDGVRADQGATR